MLTQQDIYAAGSENRPPMLNKDNYVPWSSRIIRYARSRPNGKMIVDSIENRPYVRRMIATPGEPNLPVPVSESFHEQTDEELTENDIKRMDADDQAIQTILLGLPEDVYAAVDSCETAKEIWKRVRQMMKGSDIEEQEKKAKLFNKGEKFTSTDGESIESYYQRFMQLMNDLKRNKHFLENIAANLKFLNNLQHEWKRHVTIVRQTKNFHEADFTQIYDFLKMNQDEVNELRAERLAKTHDPFALMDHSQNSYNFPASHNDQSSSNINDPTEAMNAAFILFAKAFQLTAPTNNNQRTSSNPHNRQIAQPVINMSQDRQIQNVGGNDGNQFGQYAGQVNQSLSGIFINQSNYVNEILKKYGLNTCDNIGTPMDIKDKLDLDQIEPQLMQRNIDSGFELTGFLDADYAGCKDTFKSTSGGAQFLGEKLVSWSSKKQDCTSLSTAESEYVSLSACCAQVLWMRTQLTDYGYHFDKIPIYCDSKSAIAIFCNPLQHFRMKHIAVRYHFINEHIEKGTIELYFVKTDYQLADIFTKALPVDRFNYLVRRLGMRNLCPQELDRLAKSQ
nr:copia protein [Tanacetum cinerariifolium]